MKELTELQKLIYDLNQKGYTACEIAKLIDRHASNIYFTINSMKKKGFEVKSNKKNKSIPIPKIEEVLKQDKV